MSWTIAQVLHKDDILSSLQVLMLACHEFVLGCYFRSFSSGMDMLAACGDNELGMIITPRNNTDIHSPHYPGEYPSSINCKWRIKADHGYQVKLHIMGYELEEK